MALNFQHSLQKSLEKIQLTKYHHFLVHEDEEERNLHNSDELVSKYGDHKWAIVDLLNEKYNLFTQENFDLRNWVEEHEHDEVAYFLNEVGSNTLSHSEFKAPHKFHLWLGKKGFVVGIEQKGQGFNAEEVNEKRLKDNEGKAFEFFRSCKSRIFFDDKNNSRIVFMEHLI